VPCQARHKTAQSALSSAFMVENELKKLGFGLGLDLTIIGNLYLNVKSKIKFKKTKVAYGLVKDIKGYHIHFGLFSNSSIEKSYDGHTIESSLLGSFGTFG
jgi:hypothetical protein